MYGLLLDSIQKFLCEKYGEQRWEKIRRRANLKHIWFVTHEVYGEGVLMDLVKAATIELEEDSNMVMRMFGEYFARNIGHYGYARLLRVLGRDLRDFLNGLDDLHEYLRFSYPKMSPPSFFCEGETEHGLVLHYTTKRSGFLQYVIGQLTTVGRIYGKELEIGVISEEKIGQSSLGQTITHFTLDLKFDNSELLFLRRLSPMEKHFSVDASTFLGVFPFCLLLDEDLVVWRVGVKLQEVLPDLAGNHLEDCFSIRKPMLPKVSGRQVCLHANCVFELVSLLEVVRNSFIHAHPDTTDPHSHPQPLRLKGQMLPLPKMKAIAFLCSPVIQSPEELYDNGIYVNDLSMHDSSRDVILAGSQRDPELNIALSQEKIRTAQLEESIQQTDRLLFQMIPKPIADQLRGGETPLNTCREFSSVSILFSDIVSFTPMCSRLHPMEVVCVLNALYVAYDELCEEHSVYKLETIGDAYMVICGAPVCTLRHAEHITGFAFAIIDATSKINDPSTSQPLRIRVGIHSGNVVAGVVGSTILRYDVFGDTVNVAARMEATGSPMKIHISEATAKLLQDTPFTVKPRGSVDVKGKGCMSTFWVTGKDKHSKLLPKPESFAHPNQELSSPHGRHHADPPSPRTGRSFSPPSPQMARLTLPPSSLRPLSPKPSEWPQAQEQLEKFPIEDAYGMSTPPRARRNTVPMMPSHQLDLGKTPRRLHDENRTSMPLSEVSSMLRNQGQLIERQASITDFASLSKGVLDRGERKQSACPHFGEDVLGSELNLMHLRGSISVPFTSRGSISVQRCPDEAVQEMEEFSVYAEENAKQARQLADWASNMVHRLKATQDVGITIGIDDEKADSDTDATLGGETFHCATTEDAKMETVKCSDATTGGTTVEGETTGDTSSETGNMKENHGTELIPRVGMIIPGVDSHGDGPGTPSHEAGSHSKTEEWSVGDVETPGGSSMESPGCDPKQAMENPEDDSQIPGDDKMHIPGAGVENPVGNMRTKNSGVDTQTPGDGAENPGDCTKNSGVDTQTPGDGAENPGDCTNSGVDTQTPGDGAENRTKNSGVDKQTPGDGAENSMNSKDGVSGVGTETCENGGQTLQLSNAEIGEAGGDTIQLGGETSGQTIQLGGRGETSEDGGQTIQLGGRGETSEDGGQTIQQTSEDGGQTLQLDGVGTTGDGTGTTESHGDGGKTPVRTSNPSPPANATCDTI